MTIIVILIIIACLLYVVAHTGPELKKKPVKTIKKVVKKTSKKK